MCCKKKIFVILITTQDSEVLSNCPRFLVGCDQKTIFIMISFELEFLFLCCVP